MDSQHCYLVFLPMSRWIKDEVDVWCEQWAAQRRKILGITELQPKERIGRLNSTLGSVKEEGEGASYTSATQSFPEVYTGLALLVNRAWHDMPPKWRPVINVHYVYAGPIKQKAAAVGLVVRTYWDYMSFAKNYIHSFVVISTKYPDDEVQKVIRTQNTAANA